MGKKILAIFFVSILLCSYIIPTTSAFADVVIGDNDSYAVTQLGVENGKKIATMEAILQLLESGVSEINFNDISDLDDYLEDFYDELTNINYQDVSNEILAGAYYDVKELKQWIDDRGEYIATYYKDYLNSADEGLSDIFNDFQLKLPKSRLVGTTLNGFRSLSRFNGDNPTPTPNPPSDYQAFIQQLTNSNVNNIDLNSGGPFRGQNNHMVFNFSRPCSWYCQNPISATNWSGCIVSPLLPTSIHITTYENGTCSYTISQQYAGTIQRVRNSDNAVLETYRAGYLFVDYSPYIWFTEYGWNISFPTVYSFNSLTLCFNQLVKEYKYVDVYVDGVLWGQTATPTVSNPTLDIDGIIKLYGNDNPIQYDFPQDTQIDYNALYTTIYNAIRDNLPLDMQTINNNQVYYDSHDTVYSPTIYNYYGKDGDDENDWIDSILDYATIPDFNSALGTVAVLDTPFVNGITIVNAGVTDVIPSDILLIFGGFFVLVLFVCIINRMSE